MVLSHEEMKKIFENHGFSGFELRHYDDNMEKLLSFAAEDLSLIHILHSQWF